MTENSRQVRNAGLHPPETGVKASSESAEFIRAAAAFVLIGLALYAALWAASEYLIDRYAHRNRFFLVKTAPRIEYDYVILGASHAVVLDNRDMNARLEEMTGRNILNLATVGAGVRVNELVLDYFLAKHQTRAVVYVLDSFGFYSSEWNEERLQDTRLFLRAPWDLTLARLLLSAPAARSVAIDYISGFSKINNPNRFEPDLHEHERSPFERVYRPIEQIDRQRINYLYPGQVDAASLRSSPYLSQFEEWIGDLQSRDIRFLIVRPPIPGRVRSMIPNEAVFDETLRQLAARSEIAVHDFSAVNNDKEFFFDTDHLNQRGVMSFFENHLAPLLTAGDGN